MKHLSKTVLIFILFISPLSLFSLEMSVRAAPTITFPMGGMSSVLDSPVIGGSLNFDFNFLDLINVGPEINLNVMTKSSDQSKIIDFAPGLNFGVHYSPLSRLMLQGGLCGGLHMMNLKTSGIPEQDGTYAAGNEPQSYTGWQYYGKVYGSGSFRINPNLSVGLEASYIHHLLDNNISSPLLSGLQLGLTGKYTFDTRKNAGKLTGTLNQDEPLFTLYSNIYKNAPFAVFELKNTESAEIKNVQVSFRSVLYSASELVCCEPIEKIKKGRSVEVPVYADFSNDILKFTENGQIQGEIVVTYELLGKPRSYTESVIIPVYNRNALRWVDPAILAVLVSPNSNEVMELSKSIVGIARDDLKTGLNRNLQFAMYMVEAVNAMGIEVIPDPITPYASYHLDDTLIDSIQFPYQTLTYRSGDCDDLAVLLMALFESVGVDSSFIPLTDDMIILVNLGNAKTALSIVSNENRLVLYDDDAWLPLSMNTLKEGFYKSWISAADIINGDSDEYLEMVVLKNAWESYAPMGVSTKATYSKPNPDEIKKRTSRALSALFELEIGPKIAYAKSEVAKNPSAENYNTLGLLYVRSGDFKNAKDVFGKAAKTGNVPAMSNLANIALLENDLNSAATWYKKVLEINPEHKGALKGLERIQNETEN